MLIPNIIKRQKVEYTTNKGGSVVWWYSGGVVYIGKKKRKCVFCFFVFIQRTTRGEGLLSKLDQRPREGRDRAIFIMTVNKCRRVSGVPS